MPLTPAGDTTRQVAEALSARQAQATGVRRAGGAGWLLAQAPRALAQRRAVREFAPGELRAARVLGVVSAAHEVDDAMWPAPEAQHPGRLDVLIAAFRLTDVPAGLYPVRGTVLGAPLPGTAWLDSLRELYADAPAILLICGDVDEAGRATGAAAYASALVRAGAFGYAAWLAAVCDGLVGCVYGGASHQVTHAARTLSPDLRHLFTFALGAPAAPGSNETSVRGR